jgi:hypothetical protein
MLKVTLDASGNCEISILVKDTRNPLDDLSKNELRPKKVNFSSANELSGIACSQFVQFKSLPRRFNYSVFSCDLLSSVWQHTYTHKQNYVHVSLFYAALNSTTPPIHPNCFLTLLLDRITAKAFMYFTINAILELKMCFSCCLS